MITSMNQQQLDMDISVLSQHFDNLSINRGNTHNYLGMAFDFSLPDCVCINMHSYIDELLSMYDVEGIAATRSKTDLFVIDKNDRLLDKDDKDKFHSMVVKVMYLAKGCRPDLLLTVAFLSTRVRTPSDSDKNT